MTRRHVQFHRLAWKEYLHERRWYARRSERAAGRFESAIDAAIARIAENPLQFPEFRAKVRWVRPRRFPHVLYFYLIDETTIEILAIAHGKRRIGYWLGRTMRP